MDNVGKPGNVLALTHLKLPRPGLARVRETAQSSISVRCAGYDMLLFDLESALGYFVKV